MRLKYFALAIAILLFHACTDTPANIKIEPQNIESVSDKTEWISYGFHMGFHGHGGSHIKFFDSGTIEMGYGKYKNRVYKTIQIDPIITGDILSKIKKIKLENASGGYHRIGLTDGGSETVEWQLNGLKGKIYSYSYNVEYIQNVLQELRPIILKAIADGTHTSLTMEEYFSTERFKYLDR